MSRRTSKTYWMLSQFVEDAAELADVDDFDGDVEDDRAVVVGRRRDVRMLTRSSARRVLMS